ncbi:lytic transglycosylase domain-containing protein [Propionicimonas sp. T2.31MG-18]|uniref:lytic transglycosylase domain-containing protein n=1 Tax=Propionicimonas sp. T2.31MG-18 TaxID=3157620 RepID=UPI003673614F
MAVLRRVGAFLGAFGLVAVVIGGLAMGAMQRSAAAVAKSGEHAAARSQGYTGLAEPVGPTPSARQPDPEPERHTTAVAPQPLQRIDQAWAQRTAAAAGIPQRALLAYASATVTVSAEQPGCGLSWNTLAGIGAVESAHASHGGTHLLDSGFTRPAILGPSLNGRGVGTIRDTDNGALDGDRVWDRAVGPMQFIPSTWRRWGADGNGDGRADPNQIDDAALTAARYLCASGSLTTPERWRAAVLSYNHSGAYVDAVAAAANTYAAAARR